MILYHNHRCSKSREALAWLQQQNAPLTVVDYQQNPLNEAQLRDLANKLGVKSVREMMRVKDDLFSELGLANADEATLLHALAQHPKLLERPILVHGERAAIGRPLSNIQALME
ncbi:arsenate reductase (glutaredoxin) [Neisseriaceae bacterium B1]